MKWWDQMPWFSFFGMLNFKRAFSCSSFTFIKRHFCSSSIFVIRLVSSVYLRYLIFLLAILISSCASSSLVFHMIYSTYKLNKQGGNIQPWHTPFPILNQSVAPCPVLTVASWLAHRFLRRQIRWSGISISLRIFHSLLWSTLIGFTKVNEAEVDGGGYGNSFQYFWLEYPMDRGVWWATIHGHKELDMTEKT